MRRPLDGSRPLYARKATPLSKLMPYMCFRTLEDADLAGQEDNRMAVSPKRW